MRSTYQESVLERLSDIADGFRHPKYGTSVRTAEQHRFSNSLRVIAQDPTSLTALATADLDFQPHKVHASINECMQPGQPQIGPRRAGVYWWTPGDQADNAEVARFLSDWTDAIRLGMTRLEIA